MFSPMRPTNTNTAFRDGIAWVADRFAPFVLAFPAGSTASFVHAVMLL